MLVIKILLGLVGLGIVVFVHELGHFIAARISGIEVEAFSIGWGPPILKKKIKNVEYRIGAFPLGGYCKMKGENEFQEAWENHKKFVEGSPDSYFGVSPFKRIFTCLMGPVFNLIFAVLTLSVIWGCGFEVNTEENRIVLLSDVNPGNEGGINPADAAGLKTGDRILEISGKTVSTYYDIREAIIINPEVNLPFVVERDGSILQMTVRPRLDKSNGSGLIGIYSWTDPVVAAVGEESAAFKAGLLPGDRITRVNGKDLPYTVALIPFFSELENTKSVTTENDNIELALEYERSGSLLNTVLNLKITENGAETPGISWQGVKYRTPKLNPFGALAKGAEEAVKIVFVSIKSLSLLFRGIDLTQAVSGPVRITYLLGDVAAEGFSQGFGIGLGSAANFLALISIALCIMNLLPLPVIDGGMILLFLIEAVRRKPSNPRAIYVYQTIGAVLIFSLMIFAVFGDIVFLTRR